MTAVAAPPQAPDLREPKGWRSTKNRIMTILMVLSFVLVIIPLGFVLFTVIAKGASIISWQFLTGSPIPPNVLPAGIGGMWPAVLGTLLITGLATVLAVPLGVLGAIYLNEYGQQSRLARLIRFLSEIMLGVPSIVMGLFIFTVIAKGASIISWQFLTGSPIPPNTLPADVGGMWPAILGTIEITALATLLAVPLGVLGAIYLNEYGGRGWLAALIGFMSDVMTGVPSIVMGLFIFSIWVLHFGYSGFAGALALGCLMPVSYTHLTLPTTERV